MLPQIAQAMTANGRTYEIWVIDDDSNDDTPQVVAEAAANMPVNLVIRKENRDLSLAVVEGLRRATGNLLVVMDADLSHPPERIPNLLTALEQPPTDFVIGSRFASGGRTEDWNSGRRLNSYVATLLCKPLVGPIRDPMAGFFALSRSTLQRTERLDPIGYKIGLELICRCRCQHVVEVPIVFRNRVRGESKLSIEQQRRYLEHLGRLYRDCRPVLGVFIRPVLGIARFLLKRLPP